MKNPLSPLQKTSTRRGFTIVELLVIIVVIGILAGMSVVGYNSIKVSSRDEQRKTNATALAGALEKYFSRNGEYPAPGSLIGQPIGTVKTKLGLSNVSILRMPDGADNSLSSTTLTPATLKYTTADLTSGCSSGTTGCTNFTLQWKSEKSPGVITTLSSNY